MWCVGLKLLDEIGSESKVFISSNNSAFQLFWQMEKKNEAWIKTLGNSIHNCKLSNSDKVKIPKPLTKQNAEISCDIQLCQKEYQQQCLLLLL